MKLGKNIGTISKKLRKYLFAGYIAVGILTVIVNLVVFHLSFLLWANVFVSTFLGNLFSIVVNYSGLSNVFKSDLGLRRAFKYFISWISYYFLTIWLVILFINLNFLPLIARVVTLFVLTPINYFAQKKLVFN